MFFKLYILIKTIIIGGNMKKKFGIKTNIALILILLTALFISACGDGSDPQPDTYLVIYDANTGTGDVPVDANDYEEGETVTVLGSGTLTRDGYTFEGWNTQADGNGTAYNEDDEIIMGTEDITLYAIWIREIGGSGVLIVNCDPSAAGAMINALSANNYNTTTLTTLNDFEQMSLDTLFDYDAVFYAGGDTFDSWAKAKEYLDEGGRFFIADDDLGWHYHFDVFYEDYLQADWNSDGGSLGVATGMDIMNGINPDINFNESEDPYTYPDDFTVGAEGVEIFQAASEDYSAGVSVDRDGYKAVYLAWDFQYTGNTDHANAIIDRIAIFLGVPRDVPLVIGDSYGGGKVAYILLDGDAGYDADVQHGLIAATIDQTDSIVWHYSNSDAATGASGTTIGTGKENTDIIVAEYGTENNAAKLCDDYSVTVNSVTYDDWYLPSLDELDELYAARLDVGNFNTAFKPYWSSSELNSSSAWSIFFGTGEPGTSGGKNAMYRVRAVRSF